MNFILSWYSWRLLNDNTSRLFWFDNFQNLLSELNLSRSVLSRGKRLWIGRAAIWVHTYLEKKAWSQLTAHPTSPPPAAYFYCHWICRHILNCRNRRDISLRMRQFCLREQRVCFETLARGKTISKSRYIKKVHSAKIQYFRMSHGFAMLTLPRHFHAIPRHQRQTKYSKQKFNMQQPVPWQNFRY